MTANCMTNDKFSKGNQRAKILIANPNFQEAVRLVREKFDIPSEGFIDQEINEKWHHDFYIKDDDYFSENWMKTCLEIKKLREEKKFNEAYELQQKFNNESPVNAFRIAVKLILLDFRLPLGWEESIRRYILFNDIDHMWIPSNIVIRQDFDKDTLLTRLSILIDDSTTLEDIKNAWPRIKHFQEKLQSYSKKKNQPIKNFERDQLAYNLKQSGKTYNEIADELSKSFNKTFSYDDVASFIKRYKKTVGIN